jgi:hypothetical protein
VVPGVVQSGGKLLVARTLGGNAETLALPLFFAFPGTLSVPEARVAGRAALVIPARRITVTAP